MIKRRTVDNSLSITPDLTPLLDIIFIVMVFLMLTAAVKLNTLDVQLPNSDSQATKPLSKESLTINLLKTAPYWGINGQPSSDWESFKDTLQQRINQDNSKKQDVIIAADKQVEVHLLLKLFTFLQENNIQATQVLMEEN